MKKTKLPFIIDYIENKGHIKLANNVYKKSIKSPKKAMRYLYKNDLDLFLESSYKYAQTKDFGETAETLLSTFEALINETNDFINNTRESYDKLLERRNRIYNHVDRYLDQMLRNKSVKKEDIGPKVNNFLNSLEVDDQGVLDLEKVQQSYNELTISIRDIFSSDQGGQQNGANSNDQNSKQKKEKPQEQRQPQEQSIKNAENYINRLSNEQLYGKQDDDLIDGKYVAFHIDHFSDHVLKSPPYVKEYIHKNLYKDNDGNIIITKKDFISLLKEALNYYKEIGMNRAYDYVLKLQSYNDNDYYTNKNYVNKVFLNFNEILFNSPVIKDYLNSNMGKIVEDQDGLNKERIINLLMDALYFYGNEMEKSSSIDNLIKVANYLDKKGKIKLSNKVMDRVLSNKDDFNFLKNTDAENLKEYWHFMLLNNYIDVEDIPKHIIGV